MTCPHSTHLHIHVSGGDIYVYADQYKVLLPIHPYPTPTPKTSLGIYNTSPVCEWTMQQLVDQDCMLYNHLYMEAAIVCLFAACAFQSIAKYNFFSDAEHTLTS